MHKIGFSAYAQCLSANCCSQTHLAECRHWSAISGTYSMPLSGIAVRAGQRPSPILSNLRHEPLAYPLRRIYWVVRLRWSISNCWRCSCSVVGHHLKEAVILLCFHRLLSDQPGFRRVWHLLCHCRRAMFQSIFNCLNATCSSFFKSSSIPMDCDVIRRLWCRTCYSSLLSMNKFPSYFRKVKRGHRPYDFKLYLFHEQKKSSIQLESQGLWIQYITSGFIFALRLLRCTDFFSIKYLSTTFYFAACIFGQIIR